MVRAFRTLENAFKCFLIAVLLTCVGCGPTSHALRRKLMVPKEAGFPADTEGQGKSNGTLFLFNSPIKYPSQNYLTQYYTDEEIRIALEIGHTEQGKSARLLVLHLGRSIPEYNDHSCSPVSIGPTVRHYDRARMYVVDSEAEFNRRKSSLVPLEMDWIVLARQRSPVELAEVAIVPPRYRFQQLGDQYGSGPIQVRNCQRLPTSKEKWLRILGPLGYILAVPVDIITFPIWVWGLAGVG